MNCIISNKVTVRLRTNLDRTGTERTRNKNKNRNRNRNRNKNMNKNRKKFTKKIFSSIQIISDYLLLYIGKNLNKFKAISILIIQCYFKHLIKEDLIV